MLAESLLSCPFCGSEGAIHHSSDTGTDMVYVSCVHCNASTAVYQLELTAVRNWNRRANTNE